MSILFPDENGAAGQQIQSAIDKIVQTRSSVAPGDMLGARLDVSGNQRILVNDGTNDKILIGYQLNGF